MGMEGEGMPSAPAQGQGMSESGAHTDGQVDNGGQDRGAPSPRPTSSAPEDAAGEYYKRLDAINRKEREMVEQRKRYQGYESKMSEMEKELTKYRSLKDQISRDPESLLKAYDLDLEKYSEMLINNNDGKVTREHLHPMQDELKQVREELRALKESREQEREHQIEERNRITYDSFVGEATAHINQNLDKYPVLSEEPDNDQLVFDTIRHVWENSKDEKGNGRFLSIEEACDYLDKTLANRYRTALQSDRRRKALGISFADEQKREGDRQNPPRYSETPQTISSRYSNQSAPPISKRTYSQEERADSIKRMLFGE